MNKKGFTLVELLGVLVIMAIIMVIVVTPIIGQIRNTAKKLDNASLQVLYKSTASYLDANKNLYPKSDGMIYYISVGQLIDSDKLVSSYLSSYSEEVLSRSNVVEVTVKDGGYQYSFADSSENLSTLYKAYQDVDNDSIYSYTGGTYFSGQAENNYVYYSGFMWRIMGINEDGSIKMIADEPVTTLNFGNDSLYKNSYVNEWLNDYFLSRLNYSDFLVKQKECYTTAATISINEDVCADLVESAFDHTKVSQLSLYEYNMSILNGITYLDNDTLYSTLTYSAADTSKLFAILADGSITTKNVNSMHYIRPVISVMPDATITSGAGSYSNPYILLKQTASAENRTLSSLNLSDGEYIRMYHRTYRVVDNDKSSVKLILNDIYNISDVDYSSTFGSSSTFDMSEGLAQYLNNTLYDNEYQFLKGIVKTGFWYQGDSTSLSSYYKSTSLSKTGIIYGVYVGLPKIGELLTVPIYGETTNNFWTISKSSNTTINTISSAGVTETNVSSNAYVRPVVILESDTLVESGNGTADTPYRVIY
jgi:prepilin-type N-terminal cleavage/methylation domain-containing protein